MQLYPRHFMFNKLGILIFFTILGKNSPVYSQKMLAPDIYMVEFTDKLHNTYTLSKPQEFLSRKALERRQKQNIPLHENDLPVSNIYLDSLKNKGFTILNVSKWFNAATLQITNELQPEQLLDFKFIIQSKTKTVQLLKKNTIPAINKFFKLDTLSNAQLYGNSLAQLTIHKGEYLHNQNYKGVGIIIAVLDGGFYGVKDFSSLQKLWDDKRLILQRDIADPTFQTYYDYSHGTNVLSIMAGYKEGMLVGTAPEANYALIRTEDAHLEENGNQYEYPVEEFNWVVGAELADSLGADVINTSLGYSQFNNTSLNYTYQQMDGKTAISSRGANIAFTKGMIIVVSAGNEGSSPWYYITAPSDGENILCVGAINNSKQLAPFSSRGPSSDNRIKPDIVAIGQGTWLENGTDNFISGNGTSFAAPVISGLTACLWQANPSKTNLEIITAIRKSASQYQNPDYLTGYGIANFQRADSILKNNIHLVSSKNPIKVFPNPFNNVINIEYWHPLQNDNVTITIYNTNGQIIDQLSLYGENGKPNLIRTPFLANLPKGIYILQYESGLHKKNIKIIKK